MQVGRKMRGAAAPGFGTDAGPWPNACNRPAASLPPFPVWFQFGFAVAEPGAPSPVPCLSEGDEQDPHHGDHRRNRLS
jgi:hypothetical protein